MKRIWIFPFLFLLLARANAQNEFAANAFYNQFKLIYEDAQVGFINCKGDKRKSDFEELATEYRTKLMLPLADSGKLVVPVNGNPYVIYYFEPDKLRLKVDQRGANLRDAVITAFNKPLYARTETRIINNQPFTTTTYYTEPGESPPGPALFRQLLYYQSGKFYLTFEIKGKKQPLD